MDQCQLPPPVDVSKIPYPPVYPESTNDKAAIKKFEKEIEEVMDKRFAIFDKEMKKFDITMEKFDADMEKHSQNVE